MPGRAKAFRHDATNQWSGLEPQYQLHNHLISQYIVFKWSEYMRPLNCVISCLQHRKWDGIKGNLSKQNIHSHLTELFYAKCMLHTLPGSIFLSVFREWTVDVIDDTDPWGHLLCMSLGGWQSPEHRQRFSFKSPTYRPSSRSLTCRFKMRDTLYWLRLDCWIFPQCGCCTDTVQAECYFCQSRSIFIPVVGSDFSCLIRFSVLESSNSSIQTTRTGVQSCIR